MSVIKVRDSGLARAECWAMRSAMKAFSLFSIVAVLFLSACDRHQWEGENGVKELYKHESEGHGKGHAEGGEHGKGEKADGEEEAH